VLQVVLAGGGARLEQGADERACHQDRHLTRTGRVVLDELFVFD
jgi:uncharacterized protein with ACT and thioredoxin-like domain